MPEVAKKSLREVYDALVHEHADLVKKRAHAVNELSIARRMLSNVNERIEVLRADAVQKTQRIEEIRSTCSLLQTVECAEDLPRFDDAAYAALKVPAPTSSKQAPSAQPAFPDLLNL